jgi:predicted nucleotidyltransferase
MLNKDYKEMLQCLLEENVRFLLVGAYALAVHGFPRATKDIDFFVWATPENAANLIKALVKFGAPLHEVSARDFSSEGIIFQIGNSPRRIDIITTISGIKFEQAYTKHKSLSIEGMNVPVISLEDLIVNKKASGRAQDLADVEKLEAALRSFQGQPGNQSS